MPKKIKCKKADNSVCKANGCGVKQVFECNVDYGLKCLHADQPVRNGEQCMCCDWKVKFLCPEGMKFLNTRTYITLKFTDT